MRVMRVIAGNYPYNVRNMSKTKYIEGLKDYPPFPVAFIRLNKRLKSPSAPPSSGVFKLSGVPDA